MRWHLLKTFDKIYIIDLHGNAKKKEVSPDGSPDENVFDIQQGVSINIFVKTGKKEASALAQVFHHDVFGKRNEKYDFLSDNSLSSISMTPIRSSFPMHFMVQKDFSLEHEYNNGLVMSDLFGENLLGILTKRDSLSVGFSIEDISGKIAFFLNRENSIEDVCRHFGLKLRDNDKWDALESRNSVSSTGIAALIKDCEYRPFDTRQVFYSPHFVARINKRVLQHLVNRNAGLILGRQGQAVGGEEWNVVFVTDSLSDQNIYRRGGGTVFPLYLYPDSSQLSTEGQGIRPNLDEKLAQQLAAGMGCAYAFEEARAWQHGQAGEVLPLDILDYIYAVLHSRAYREKYKEFLKIDFPRVPWPTDEVEFRRLVALGAELRQYHLMEHPALDDKARTIGYPVQGSNTVENSMTAKDPGFVPTVIASDEGAKQSASTDGLPRSARNDETGNVFINATQHFTRVPAKAWEFYIGGYQPAQKWLKDRKGRTLTFDDIMHYRKIIAALSETDRLMGEIDGVGVEP